MNSRMRISVNDLFLYSIIVASLIGANVLSINIGIAVTPFRILILMAGASLFLHKSNQTYLKPVLKKKERYYSVFYSLWLIIAIIGFIWARDRSAWFKALFYVVIACISAWYVPKRVNNVQLWIKCIRILCAFVAIHNIIGWYETLTHNYLFLSDADKLAGYAKWGFPSSSLGVNGFATFLTLTLPFVLLCFFLEHGKLRKSIYLILMLSSVALLFRSYSRANIIAFVIMLLVMFLFISKNKKIRILATCLIFALLVCRVLFADTFIQLLDKVSGSLTVKINQTSYMNSDTERWNLLLNAFDFLKQTFGFGIGAGNQTYWLQNRLTYFTDGKLAFHNWWAEFAVEYGVLAFILYIVFYVKLLRGARKLANSNDHQLSLIGICIVMMMVGFVISCISSSSILKYDWLWILWGLIIAAVNIEQTSDESQHIEKDVGY